MNSEGCKKTSSCACEQIITWFSKNHCCWVRNDKLVSWAGRLGIKLNDYGNLDYDQLFQLFVLAVLWNNEPTFEAERGEEAFRRIKQDYTLRNFAEAIENNVLAGKLRNIAEKVVRNVYVFDLLLFIIHGRVNGENAWAVIKRIVNQPGIGVKADDVTRLRQLYGIFNPRKYEGNVYLTVKSFLIFREIRIQFRDEGKYQYHPAICCIPDSNVREALRNLNLLDNTDKSIDNLIDASEVVADHFCTNEYELYDLPLFFWQRREKKKSASSDKKPQKARPFASENAGICPKCGSKTVWRTAKRTGERYRGCTNFDNGCRWNDRSY